MLSKYTQVIQKIAIILALIVVSLGAYTRLKHAGLGCPDWPKCFENWIVHANITTPALTNEASEKAWIEMIHRYAAGVLSMIIFALRFYMPTKQSSTRINAICFLIIIQALFGMWTVTWRLHPLAVMPHLIGGMTITTLLCIDYQKKYTSPPIQTVPTQIHGYLQILWIAILIQIIVGGWTSANYAALVCPDFPSCQGQWFIPMHYLAQGFTWPFGFHTYEGGVISGEGRMAIHMTHRWGALICTLLILRIGWLVRQAKQTLSTPFIKWFKTLSALFIGQIILGVLNVIWQLPIGIAVGHNVIALALLISISVLLCHSAHKKDLETTATNFYQHAII